MRTKFIAALILAVALSASCAPTPGTGSTTPTTAGGTFTTWALGDSQGAPSNDPARGLPWTELLGAVGNGAVSMEGAGWTVASPHTGRTVVEQAQQIVQQRGPVDFVVMAGINDLGAGRSVTQMLQGVQQLEALAAVTGGRVLYVGIVPITQGSYVEPRNADRLAFNESLAGLFPGRYLDCSASMSTGDWLTPSYALGPQNLHLNAAGEQALAACISTAV